MAWFPPPPWLLRGSAVLVPAAAGRRGLLLAAYGDGATLAYHELIVFGGVRRAGLRVGWEVAAIWVDSAASRDGGRAIWGLPKQLATFRWSEGRVSVADRDGSAIVVANVQSFGDARMPLPLVPAVFGRRGGRELWTVAFGSMRGAPAVVTVDAPSGSLVTRLALTGTRPGLVGHRLRLAFGRPRVVGSAPPRPRRGA